MLRLAESHISSLAPYVPGKAVESPSELKSWAKLASNENCLGPSPAAIAAAQDALKYVHLYPNAQRYELKKAIADHFHDYGVNVEQIALGNGTSELIVNLVRGMVARFESILTCWPTFIMYRLAARVHNRKEATVPLEDGLHYNLEELCRQAHDTRSKPVKLVFVANPNNPTGTYANRDQFDEFVKDLPKDVILVIDEAYYDYVEKKDYPHGVFYAVNRPRTLILRTFSKAHGLAGLRLGYALGDSEIIDVLNRVRDPFNVNCVAQFAALASLKDPQHIIESVEHNTKMRDVLTRGISEFGFEVNESAGNFIYAKRSSDMPTIEDLCEQLMTKGVSLRPLGNYGLFDHVRITVGTSDEVDHLFQALKEVI